MKLAIALCLCMLLALTVARPGDDHYTDKYDNVNLDEVLSNEKILNNYIDCIMDKGKCTPDAKELKEHIREALENECGKCNEKQKDGAKKVIAHLINHHEGAWNELTSKYDPEKKFTAKYEKELRELKQ